MSSKFRHALLPALLALSWMGAFDSAPRDGGDTHWLGACDRDGQCGSGQCLCGLCTRGCSGDDACKENSACFELDSAGVSQRCADRTLPDTTGICLGLCKTTATCAKGMECLLGACVPAVAGARDASAPGKDTGAPGKDTGAPGKNTGAPGKNTGAPGKNTGAPGKDAGAPSRSPTRPPPISGLPSATDYADVHVPVDFTQPVDLPPPATKVTGDVSRFAGRWVLQDHLSNAPCTPDDSGLCKHLDVRRSDDGSFSVTLSTDVMTNASGTTKELQGPYPPVSDPNVGYPPSFTPDQYGLFQNFVGGFGYQGFDPVVESGQLDFWISTLEVYSQWCGMQTPYQWNIAGDVRYRCVPQGGDTSSIDLGKQVLCRTSWDGPQCDTGGEIKAPCECMLSDGAPLNSPICYLYAPICECTSTTCSARLRSTKFRSRFTREGDILKENFSDGFNKFEDSIFVKEAP